VARVPAVWRRSWKRRPGTPARSVAGTQTRRWKLPRRRLGAALAEGGGGGRRQGDGPVAGAALDWAVAEGASALVVGKTTPYRGICNHLRDPPSLDRRPMTNVTPGSDKERAWVEDHQRHHHRGEVINAATPSSSELPPRS
jgi:hypothetical protein